MQLLENPNVQIVLVILLTPVLTAILSFVCGLSARIPGLPPSIKASIGRIFTSFEAEITPANVKQLVREAIDGQVTQIATTVADRAVAIMLAAIVNTPKPVKPVPEDTLTDLAIHVPQPTPESTSK
jgi:hypothetical protein